MSRGEAVLAEFLLRVGLPVSPSEGRCLRFEQGWRALFTPADDAITVTLCIDSPWELVTRAERLLPLIDLRNSLRVPVAVGAYQDALLLSSRLREQRCTVIELESALSQLLQLAETACS